MEEGGWEVIWEAWMTMLVIDLGRRGTVYMRRTTLRERGDSVRHIDDVYFSF
jgi:hypothetical protein